MSRIYDSIVDTVGNTPLVKLQRITDGAKAQVALKLEFFNPLLSPQRRNGWQCARDWPHAGYPRACFLSDAAQQR
jgi:cysteine synthase